MQRSTCVLRRNGENDTTSALVILMTVSSAQVYEQRKNWPAALEVYNRAVLLAPNSSLVLFKRVRMLVECGQYEVSHIA